MRIKIGIKDNEIFIRKDENFVEWLKDRVKKYGKDLSKVDLKKVYESQFEELKKEDPVIVFKQIAETEPVTKKISLDKSYEKEIEERWNKVKR
ncbi:MAG: hypothetical protein DRP10_03885 [Candidatus Aenigmatarchaeota archaeon]|nr:MAG: hypothetical protein DRP10_03885 [Candidatus Aenigmarchaeota archaeon]